MIQKMSWIEKYQNGETAKILISKINALADRPVRFMEVCGGHTMAIHKFGIPSLLSEYIELKSGPGCPVCVSSRKMIDQAIAYSKQEDVIISTFGDLIRVPGSSSSLEFEKAKGADIRVVYSSLDSLKVANDNPNKKVVFLGIGFETTAPTTAATILAAREQNIKNFFVYSSHKIMPPVMEALVQEGVALDGFIGPGHVSVITGKHIYEFLSKYHKLGVVITGFEAIDILFAIYKLLLQIKNKTPNVEIQYSRVVKPEGNKKAQEIMNAVFELRDDWWRGLGVIPKSGLKIKNRYRSFDAEDQIEVEVEKTREDRGCICGSILKGIRNPVDCSLFANKCTPSNPVGACMVSNEGACHAFFKYKKHE